MKKKLYYVINTHVLITHVFNIISSLDSIDVKNQRKNIKILYWLTICISADNQEYISDKIDVKSAWDALKFKYKKKLQTINKQYLQKFIDYKIISDTLMNKT